MKIIDENGAAIETPDLTLGYLTDDTVQPAAYYVHIWKRVSSFMRSIIPICSTYQNAVLLFFDNYFYDLFKLHYNKN